MRKPDCHCLLLHFVLVVVGVQFGQGSFHYSLAGAVIHILLVFGNGLFIVLVVAFNIEVNAVADASYISLDGVRNNGAFQKKTTHSVSSGCFGIKRQLKLKYGDYDCVSTREIKQKIAAAITLTSFSSFS